MPRAPKAPERRRPRRRSFATKRVQQKSTDTAEARDSERKLPTGSTRRQTYRRGLVVVQVVVVAHPKRAIRNPLLELRPWIFDLIFGDFGGPFCLVFTSWKFSGARISILEGLTEFSASRESSGAHLGPIFRSFSPEV